MTDISVVIITYNEADCIEECVKSALKLSNDLIVVDSGSTDSTVSICKSFGAKVLTNPWPGYGAQRNLGAKESVNNWVLAIDADERLSPELIKELAALDRSLADAFFIPRVNYFQGKMIRFGSWGRDKVLRLYDKTKAEWDLSMVHETVKAKNGQLKTKILSSSMVHLTTHGVLEFKEKSAKYAELWAKEAHKSGLSANLLQLAYKPLFKFFQQVLIFGGILDGVIGLKLAYLISRETFLKYKLLRTYNGQE